MRREEGGQEGDIEEGGSRRGKRGEKREGGAGVATFGCTHRIY